MGLAEIEEKLTQLGGVMPIRDQITPLTASELEVLEASLGSTLPDSYREFVGRYGGSSVAAEPVVACSQPMPPYLSGEGGLPFSFFYGGRRDDTKGYSLANAMEAYSERMPRSVIPIAEDGGGNQYCLGISGAERGHVYYWDHDNEWDEEDYVDKGLPVPERLQFQNLHYVADTFDELVQLLVPDE